MRIIDQIEHPVLKITVFKMDNRVSVKFENSLYEQTFKLGEDERFLQADALRRMIDAQFIGQVQECFQLMHQNRLAAMAQHFPLPDQAAFEHIL